MGVEREASVSILDETGRERGHLRIMVRPSVPQDQAVLWDYQEDHTRDAAMESVQLVEGHEYLYRFDLPDLPSGTRIETSHPEIFDPDGVEQTGGRLRTRLYTGVLRVQVRSGADYLGALALEVRSAKLNYVAQYRWMLGEIAGEFTEFLMERFAASEQRFTLADAKDATTLYQRFAFLKHLISGEHFELAIRQILARPHRTWVEQEERRRPGQGIAAGSAVVRQIAGGPGPRVPWPGGRVDSLPETILMRRTEESLDTTENRFIKFALMHWRDVVADVEAVLSREKVGSPVARGRLEARLVRERLDEVLAADLFDDVGPLMQFPDGSQVLQRREGYRDIFRAYVQFEVGAALTWEGGEDVYLAGQRNVAALYEYWVFLRLRKAVALLCDDKLKEEQLYTVGDGLTVTLKRGRSLMVSGTATRRGRTMRLELYYNKGFGRGGGSWTLPMRPDCSLRISPEPGTPAPFGEIWIHFDAKYRIENVMQLYGTREQADDEYLRESEAAEETTGRASHTDLLKMHAYRDAIRKSAGSYVIYPGSGTDEPFRQYHELLPGLGAFALRPMEGGDPQGLDALMQFIRDVLDHMASQVTQHERGRYWERRAYDRRTYVAEAVPAAPFIDSTPADTRVLVGYVRGQPHWDWITDHRLYNVRAGARRGAVPLDVELLSVRLVLLYGQSGIVGLFRVVGNPVVMSGADLARRGYRNPQGDFYYCLPVKLLSLERWRDRISLSRVEEIRQRRRPLPVRGEPVVTTWLDLVR